LRLAEVRLERLGSAESSAELDPVLDGVFRRIEACGTHSGEQTLRLAYLLRARGRMQDAAQAFAKALAEMPVTTDMNAWPPGGLARLAGLYASSGKAESARRLIARVREAIPGQDVYYRPVSWCHVAEAEFVLGDHAAAATAWGKAAEEAAAHANPDSRCRGGVEVVRSLVSAGFKPGPDLGAVLAALPATGPEISARSAEADPSP